MRIRIMETTNHEYYVSLEVAKLLKQAGFDWKTFSHWTESDINNPDFKFSGLSDKPILYDGYTLIDEETYVGRKKDWNNYNNECPLIYNYSAPTIEVAQRWLREVKHCFVNVNIDVDDNECEDTIVVDQFTCKYIIEGFPYCNNSPGDDYIRNVYGDKKYFNLYEEAQEAGIKKVLEILLKEGE